MIKTSSLTLRVLARLLSYPDAVLRQHLPDLRAALHADKAIAASRLAELDALMNSLAHGDALAIEGRYVEIFDRGRATSLHLFEHVHGDSRDRGPAMIDLAQTYEKAGLFLAPGELPDYLPAVLEFVSTPTAERSPCLFERNGPHLQRHIQRLASAPQPLCQRAGCLDRTQWRESPSRQGNCR
jgi:nitrate reductase delta subunit